MVVDLEEYDEDRLRKTMMTRKTTTRTMTTTTIFLLSEAKQKMLSEANPCGAASFAKQRKLDYF